MVLSDRVDRASLEGVRPESLASRIAATLARHGLAGTGGATPGEVSRRLASDILGQDFGEGDAPCVDAEAISMRLRKAVAGFAASRTDGAWQELASAALGAAEFIEGGQPERRVEPGDTPAP